MIRTRVVATAMTVAALTALTACASAAPTTPGAAPATTLPATTAPTTTAPAASPTTAAPTATSPSAAAGTVACDWQPEQAGNPYTVQTGNPPTSVSARGMATMTIVTSQGTIVIAMDRAKTPCTVASFAFLADKKFFNNTHCHRLTTQSLFVLQCGDPAGNGAGGPSYTIPDENLSGATYPAGSVAMANTGQPHTGGSQFFLNYKASPLPSDYTPFGTVTKGLDVLTKIAAGGEDDSNAPGDGAPKLPVMITSLTVK